MKVHFKHIPINLCTCLQWLEVPIPVWVSAGSTSIYNIYTEMNVYIHSGCWCWVQSVNLELDWTDRNELQRSPQVSGSFMTASLQLPLPRFFEVMIQTGGDRPASCVVADRAGWAPCACDFYHDDMPKKIIWWFVCFPARLVHHLHHLLPTPPPPVPSPLQ